MRGFEAKASNALLGSLGMCDMLRIYCCTCQLSVGGEVVVKEFCLWSLWLTKWSNRPSDNHGLLVNRKNTRTELAPMLNY